MTRSRAKHVLQFRGPLIFTNIPAWTGGGQEHGRFEVWTEEGDYLATEPFEGLWIFKQGEGIDLVSSWGPGRVWTAKLTKLRASIGDQLWTTRSGLLRTSLLRSEDEAVVASSGHWATLKVSVEATPQEQLLAVGLAESGILNRALLDSL